MKNNGNRILWSVITIILVAIAGIASVVWKLPLQNNRELGEHKIRIEGIEKGQEKVEAKLEEVISTQSNLKIGQEVLIEKFKLEKEYTKKIRAIEDSGQ